MAKQQKRWTADHAGRVLDQADRAPSDQSFADRIGINAQRLSWWRGQLDRPRRGQRLDRERTEPVAFVEVTQVANAAIGRASSGMVVEVLLTNGRQLRVSEQIDAERLARLANALEGRCSA